MPKKEKMRKIAFIISLLCCIGPLSAQITHTDKGHVDQNAQKILKKAEQKINSGAVSFTVTMTNKNSEKKTTAKANADVLYNKGRYRVTFGDNIIYCDGTATWHWNKEANEVVVNNISAAEDDLLNPAAIISNHEKNFTAKYIRQEENGNAIIDMTPKKGKSYYKIRLYINSTTGILKRMEMHNYDSSSAEYQISNFKSNIKSTDNDFTFPASSNPKTDIIDMR